PAPRRSSTCKPRPISSFAVLSVFFFQAEDGIRDLYVTGVQTCALPISRVAGSAPAAAAHPLARTRPPGGDDDHTEALRAPPRGEDGRRRTGRRVGRAGQARAIAHGTRLGA